MSKFEKTIVITPPDTHKEDELVECIMFLRALVHRYPQHLDIAYEALQREYSLPPMMEAAGRIEE